MRDRQRRRCCRQIERDSRRRSPLRCAHIIVVGAATRPGARHVRRAARARGAPSSTPSRPAATRRRSGCIRRAAPARRKAACTCSTTWSSAPSCSARACSASAQSDRCFSVAKLFFAYGLGNALYFPFSVGATTILWPGAPTPANVYAVIERHRPTLFFSVPTGYGMLLAQRSRDAATRLRSVARSGSPSSAGEALPRGALRALQGSASASTSSTASARPKSLHMFISNRPGAIRPGSSGLLVRRLRGAPARRRAASRCRPARSATCGSAAIRSAPATGTSTRRPRTRSKGSWIRTGDKYTQDADGFFWYAGRSDDMLKVGGLWVSPVEVESALIAHAGGARVRRRRPRGSRRPGQADGVRRAARRRDAGARRWRASCSSSCASGWPTTSARAGSSSSPELPKTATGKIQRYRLRETVAEPRLPLLVEGSHENTKTRNANKPHHGGSCSRGIAREPCDGEKTEVTEACTLTAAARAAGVLHVHPPSAFHFCVASGFSRTPAIGRRFAVRLRYSP